jgi:hypothetical protein
VFDGTESKARLAGAFDGGQRMITYRNVYVEMDPRGGPDEPHAWQGHSADELLGDARAPMQNQPVPELSVW